MSDTIYEIGGPLAGLKLPLFPTQHGEPPGYPGCLPHTEFDPQHQYPEYELYPGSVEHWRTNMARMHPNRSFYDRQSQLQNWNSTELSCYPEPLIEQYAAPIYWNREWILQHFVAPDIPNEPGSERDAAAEVSLDFLTVKTDKHSASVSVLKMSPGSPVITISTGELDRGLYVIRIIGAVRTNDILPLRKPLFLHAEVQVGSDSSVRRSRQRLGYCDEFYDVANVYFRVEARAECTVRLWTGDDSEVDLLVHNISLDDVLAGTVRRALKTRSIHTNELAETDRDVPAQPDRDELIWNGFPPLNFQAGLIESGGPGGIPGVEPGTDSMSRAEIESEFGTWKHSSNLANLSENEQFGLVYSMSDIQEGRPLPAPYPFADTGAGLVYRSGDSRLCGRVWAPIGESLIQRISRYFHDFKTAADAWHESQDAGAAWDGALKLIRFAYSFPAIEDNNMLTCIVHDPGQYGRADRCRRREIGGAQFLGHFAFHFAIAPAYDKLFPFIQGNERLAESVGRFVPWVKSSEDVVALLDSYLLQTLAKRFMRYHYTGDGREPEYLAEIAATIGDPEVAEPLMEWLFHRTFYYPRPLAGIPDYMVTATDRDGRGTIASSSYVFGDSWTARMAEGVDVYIENGGNRKFDLHDPSRFPKILTSLYFPIRSRTAGLWTMRMGNVSGPDKDYTKSFAQLYNDRAANAWKWTKDPAFAFALKHYGDPSAWTPDEWDEISAASTQIRRAPWMDNHSRVLPGYAAFLESGLEHDDFRFRRSVMLRVGTGTGHAHNDTLDLQLHAHGVPMTINPGQRPGYSTPGDKHTRVHNTVEVDGKDWMCHHTAEVNQWDHLGGTNSWISTLADVDGARYMKANIANNKLCDLAMRQVLLVDVDEGEGSQELGPESYGPEPTNIPTGIVTPNSYVVDVFRVSGGNVHTYCFHSHVVDPVVDDLQPKTNLECVHRIGDTASDGQADNEIAEEYLREFSGDRYFGRAPVNFQATFPLQKERSQVGKGRRFHLAGTESYLLGTAYDATQPDKFTRLHVLGVENELVMRSDLNCTQWGYRIPNVYVQRRGDALESAFVAVIEPYSGDPFIESVERLPISSTSTDAMQPVAIRVTTKSGNRDFVFLNGSSDETCEATDIQVAAESAYCSLDGSGLRQVSLVGAKRFKSPEVTIKVASPIRHARLVRIDHSQQVAWIDQSWAPSTNEQLIEVRTQPVTDPDAWRTGFTITKVEPDGELTKLTFLRSAGHFRSEIEVIDEERNEITTGLPLPEGCSDFTRGWTATNEKGDRQWRVVGVDDRTFTLEGGKIDRAGFEPEGVLRLWEYGVGDEIRQSSAVDLKRLSNGEFEISTEVDVECEIAGCEPRYISAAEVAKSGGKMRF